MSIQRRSNTMHSSHKHSALRTAFWLCALLAGLLFAACSSPLTEEETVQASMPTIDVIVTNYTTPQGFNALLSPGTFIKDDVKKFTVDGEDIDGATFKGTAIEIDQNGIGTISNVSKTLWNLTLHAYSDEAGITEVLRGYALADTRNGNATVSFTLSSYSVATKGSFSLTFTYANEAVSFSSDVTAVNITLCDYDTHTVRYSESVVDDALSAWTGSGYTYEQTDLTPGYYYLEVQFKNGSQQIGMYTDVLDIQPGRKTEEAVTITNKLFTKPVAPQNVKVYRLDSSLNADYYTAIIRWDDIADNEEYYEVNVYTYTSETETMGMRVAKLTYENYNTISLNAGDAVGYAGGNLWYGSEEYALRLKTGLLYDVTVTAVNSLGSSTAVTRISADDISYDPTYEDALTGFGASAATASSFLRINTFTITYSLNNGTWQTSEAYTNNGSLLDYHIYKNEPVALRKPETIVDTSSGTEQKYPVLYLGSTDNPWKYWAQGNINGEKIEQATTHKNLFVIAIYDVNDETFDIAFDNNGLSLKANGTETITATGKQISTIDYSTVTVTIDRTKNDLFTDFEVYINGTSQGRTTNTSDTATYTFSIPFKGTYTVQVAGICNSTHYYSTEYVFSVN